MLLRCTQSSLNSQTDASGTKDLLSGVQEENVEHLFPLNLQSAEEDNTSTKRVHPPLITVHEKSWSLRWTGSIISVSSGTPLIKKEGERISTESVLTGEKATQGIEEKGKFACPFEFFFGFS